MNKKGFLNIIIAVIVAAVIAGGVYFITRNPQSIHSDWKTYTDETIGISLKYPPELGNPSKNILSTSTEIDFKGTTGNSTLLSIRSGVYYNQDLGRPMTVAELTAGKGISNITVAGKEAVRSDSPNESTIYISQDAKGNILTISAKADLLNQIIPTIIISTTPSDWKTFSIGMYGFTISLPPDYELGSDISKDVYFYIANLPNIPSFSIIVSDLNSKYDSNNPVISEEAITINGITGKKIVLKTTDPFSGKEGQCPFYEFRNSKNTYRFTGYESCFEGDLALSILNTFSFIDTYNDIDISTSQRIQVDFFPTELGQCQITTVKEIVINPDFHYGSYIKYNNGIFQILYSEAIVAAKSSQVGDQVNFCLISIPNPAYCPLGDTRGKEYSAKNIRTGEEWFGGPDQHMCGGA